MRTLVIYDTKYGNTERVARVIADAIGDHAAAFSVSQVQPSALTGLDLLFVGSPTQGGRPTAPVMKLLSDLPAGALQRTATVAFDTRIAAAERGFGLRLLTRVIGFAAPRIAKGLQARGGRAAAPPEGFIVEGTEGPLRAGELERAAAWAAGVREAVGIPAAR